MTEHKEQTCKTFCNAGDPATVGAVLEAQSQNQAEQQQQLPLKPKRILLSSQQTGLKPGAVKASPRILPAWV